MPFGIGASELLILFIVVLLLFGPRRLPEMGRSLGKSLREFKDSVSGTSLDDVELREPDQPSATGDHEVVASASSKGEKKLAS